MIAYSVILVCVGLSCWPAPLPYALPLGAVYNMATDRVSLSVTVFKPGD